MKQGLLETIIILDRSGSMADTVEETRGTINHLIKEQRELPGELSFSLVLFDHLYEPAYWRLPISQVSPLASTMDLARGRTALYDAVGISSKKLGEDLAALAESERPEKVVVYILTNGMENASRKYSFADVEAMIATQREVCKWEFHFLAADMRSVELGRAWNADSSLYFVADSANMSKGGRVYSADMRMRRQAMHDMPFKEDRASASLFKRDQKSLDEIPDPLDSSEKSDRQSGSGKKR
jgi:hypothetical protein